MYRLFVAGAIAMCLLLFDAKLNAHQGKEIQDFSETQFSLNPDLQKAYEETKALLEEKGSSSTAKTPLFPKEPNIVDFPSPVAGEEKNSEKINAYYSSVADAYNKEAERVRESNLEPFNHQVEKTQSQGLKELEYKKEFYQTLADQLDRKRT